MNRASDVKVYQLISARVGAWGGPRPDAKIGYRRSLIEVYPRPGNILQLTGASEESAIVPEGLRTGLIDFGVDYRKPRPACVGQEPALREGGALANAYRAESPAGFVGWASACLPLWRGRLIGYSVGTAMLTRLLADWNSLTRRSSSSLPT